MCKYLYIYIDSILVDDLSKVNHEQFVQNMHAIWEKANTRRTKYREQMEKSYNESHKIFM